MNWTLFKLMRICCTLFTVLYCRKLFLLPAFIFLYVVINVTLCCRDVAYYLVIWLRIYMYVCHFDCLFIGYKVRLRIYE